MSIQISCHVFLFSHCFGSLWYLCMINMSSWSILCKGPWCFDKLRSECKYQCSVLLCGECCYGPLIHSPRVSFLHIEIYVSGNELGIWCGNDKIYLCPSAAPIDSAIYREDIVSRCLGHHGHQSPLVLCICSALTHGVLVCPWVTTPHLFSSSQFPAEQSPRLHSSLTHALHRVVEIVESVSKFKTDCFAFFLSIALNLWLYLERTDVWLLCTLIHLFLFAQSL